MKKPLVCIFLFVMIVNIPLSAQDVTPGNHTHNFDTYWKDFKSTPAGLFSLERYESWEIFGYAGLATLFYVSTDMEMHEEFGLERENKPIGIPRALEHIGNMYDKPGPIYFTAGLTGLMYGSGWVFNDDKLLETTNMMIESLVISSIFTTALKVMIGRARPFVNDDPHNFKPFNFKFNNRYMSMPSGHTSSIFAMMTVIAKQYDSWYVKIPAYTFATSVAVQRMNDKKHWASDLLIGGTLGYLVAELVVNRHIYQSDNLSVRPVLNKDGLGIAVFF